MKALRLRALKIGGATAIVSLGALLISQSHNGPLSEAGLISLIGVSLLALALGGIEAPGPRSAPQAELADNHDAARQELNRNIDAAVNNILLLIKNYLQVNHAYQHKLASLNQGLSEAPARIDVQDVIVRLVNSNMEMHAKVSELSKDLEASQQQIASLRGNIAEVGKIAMIDDLTDLGNRRFFNQTLQVEIARAQASGAALCLAIADLDRFKSVNDRFGHVVGDHLLKLFANLLMRHMRDRGPAARYGGEEFTLLFRDADIDEAQRVVDNIRHELETKRWVVGAKEEPLGAVTASFGIARLALNESAESLVRRADAKLLEAKSAGRNRIAVDDAAGAASGAAVARERRSVG